MATAGEVTYPFPLGVTVNDDGVTVAVYSSVASQVQLCTFDDAGRETARTLDHVDSDIWHGAFADFTPGDQYGFRVIGPHDPPNGTRCNPAKLLLDPYAKTVTGNLSWRPSWNGARPGSADQPDPTDSAPDAPRSVVTTSSFDWGTDAPLDYPLTDTVIYELHVRGFTRNHPAVPAGHRGMFAALSDPVIVDHLQQLHVTAVELLPVQQSITDGSLAAKGLANYWGYNTLGSGLRRQPAASINLVTCHDGFTLADLVAYDAKHNLPNGENNNDGTNDNRSWNCGPDPGADGPTTDPGIAALRKRQQRNILATLLIARGVPMLQAGDERSRTQLGNNNAYCQDNATSWVDWTDSGDTAGLTAFTRTLIALRTGAPVLRAARFPAPAQPCAPSEPTANTGLQWFNPDGTPMTQAGWDQPNSFPFTLLAQDAAPNPSVLVIFNAGWEDVSFMLPQSPSGTWTIVVDTTDTGAPTAPRAGAIAPPITVTARSLIIATS